MADEPGEPSSKARRAPITSVYFTVGAVVAILLASFVASEVSRSGGHATFASGTGAPGAGAATGPIVVLSPESTTPTGGASKSSSADGSAVRPGGGAPATTTTTAASSAATSHAGTRSTPTAPAPYPPPPGATLAGEWTLSQYPGSSIATDWELAHPGTSANVQWDAAYGIGYAWFNGSSSEVMTRGPVLNTGPGDSFSVVAWVYLSNTSAFATAVSQDGSTSSGFYLQYSQPDNRWAFARVATDGADAAPSRALSNAAPTVNSWVQLVGVFDGTDNQLTLYVDGAAQGSAIDETPYATNGSFVIGRGQSNGGSADWFPGGIRGVEAFNQALTPGQVSALYADMPW
jgi:hypothetical protein